VHTDMSNPDGAFDPSVFAFPSAGRVGNLGRNTLIGPHFISQDFAVLKNFLIRASTNPVPSRVFQLVQSCEFYVA